MLKTLPPTNNHIGETYICRACDHKTLTVTDTYEPWLEIKEHNLPVSGQGKTIPHSGYIELKCTNCGNQTDHTLKHPTSIENYLKLYTK